MTRNLTLGLLMTATLATSALAATDEDGKLAAFYRRYLDEVFQQEPYYATTLGDHRFDDRLDDLSAGSRAKWMERIRHALADLPREVQYDRPFAGRAGRFRNLPARAGKVDLAQRKHAALRARSAALHRIHQRQRLPVAEPIDAAQGDEHHQRHRADAADSPRRGCRPREPHSPAAGGPGNGHRAEPRLDRLLSDRHLRANRRDAAKRRPEEGRGRGGGLPQGLSGVSRKSPPAAGRRRLAAGQGEVRQEARFGARCRAERG